MICREKHMPPKRLQPLLQTDPAGIITKVTPEPLNRTGRELHDPTEVGSTSPVSALKKLQKTDHLSLITPIKIYWGSRLKENLK